MVASALAEDQMDINDHSTFREMLLYPYLSDNGVARARMITPALPHHWFLVFRNRRYNLNWRWLIPE